jgi:uncharacterized SAM-binding protein YcdF (DUF218 family)
VVGWNFKDLGKMARVWSIIFLISGISLILISLLVINHDWLLENMWNFLVVDEEPERADVIIVLSAGTDRVAQGVKLFQSGYAERILFSGSGSNRMKNQAISLGVPADRILMEVKSGTTFENAKFSLEIMHSQGFNSAIVVTSAYHTRRSGIIFHQVFRGLDVTICAAPFAPSTPENWWKDSVLTSDVVTEYLKLIWHYLFER